MLTLKFDHILTNSQDRIFQSGVIETTFSDHLSIFCTRKITGNKHSKHKTIKIRSFRNYDKDAYLEKLKGINLPDLDESSDIDEIYNNFIIELSKIIDYVEYFSRLPPPPLFEITLKKYSPTMSL